MRDYELVAVIDPTLEDDGVGTVIGRLQDVIQEQGGEIQEVDNWGRRRLAYPIDRHQDGNYVVTQFRLLPNRVRGLEDVLQRSEEVIRHLVVKRGD